jgi:hypothetical protein
VIEYSHEQGGCKVIGGSVYRGTAIPDLVGGYLYGDYCAGWIKAAPVGGGRVGRSRDLGISVRALTSFGADQRGELYAMSQGGSVYRIVRG